MKYVVAVSGGVDSMVLLDMLANMKNHELVVAHFDHGIRPDSKLDAHFVSAVARNYDLPYETMREELGPDASEALARERRYAFLKQVAQKHDALLMTAHHLDDVVETVAINVERGTGWRGVAVLNSGVVRPLIDVEKSQLIEYARRKGIAWREDSTNASDAYLRNRLRRKLKDAPEDAKRQIRALHARQKELKYHIEEEVRQLVGAGPFYSRYFFIHMPESAAMECIRVLAKGALTRPQCARALHAVKIAKPGTKFEAGNGVTFHFSTRQFSL